MIDSLNGWIETLGFMLAVLAAVAGAYHGAKRQTAKGMAPLVGDPPVEMKTPLTQRVDELLRWLERLEGRQLIADRETAALRDEVIRTGRDLDRTATEIRSHDDRIGRLERRTENIERRCGMNHRADADPPGGGG